MATAGSFIVVLDHDDIHERLVFETIGRMVASYLKTRFMVTRERGCWTCTNIALKFARYNKIMWTADDVLPKKGALTRGIADFDYHFPDGLGLTVLNDLHCMEQTAGHAITTFKFLYVLFGHPYLPTEFRHFFLDTLISDRAKALDCYHFCPEAVFEHMHWRLDKSERDAINERNEATRGGPGDDKAIKDELDRVWLHEGGFQKAIGRLKEVK